MKPIFGLRLWFVSLVFAVSVSPVQSTQAQSIQVNSQSVEVGTGLSLAGALLPWGSLFVLQGAQAMARRGDRCAYAFAYELTTTAAQSITILSTSISVDQRPLHQGQPVIVIPDEKKIIRGRIYLTNGSNMLKFRIETANDVIEKSISAVVSGC